MITRYAHITRDCHLSAGHTWQCAPVAIVNGHSWARKLIEIGRLGLPGAGTYAADSAGAAYVTLAAGAINDGMVGVTRPAEWARATLGAE